MDLLKELHIPEPGLNSFKDDPASAILGLCQFLGDWILFVRPSQATQPRSGIIQHPLDFVLVEKLERRM